MTTTASAFSAIFNRLFPILMFSLLARAIELKALDPKEKNVVGKEKRIVYFSTWSVSSISATSFKTASRGKSDGRRSFGKARYGLERNVGKWQLGSISLSISFSKLVCSSAGKLSSCVEIKDEESLKGRKWKWGRCKQTEWTEELKNFFLSERLCLIWFNIRLYCLLFARSESWRL